ncbi:PAB2 [Symbiodinium natans]|uniref:PAB2 protein n=1 Tax=Symbiodinium natans TaxID=878477 RepID=A0A812RWC7_9DINO|nr:PAB2 [Symbiodinium natans]
MAATSSSRKALKNSLFEAIDKDGDGFLKEGEMMKLAKLVGFEGDADEWKQEYAILCKEVKASEEQGVPKAVVLKLLDDKSDTGCYCTDEELQLLLSAQPRPGAKRQKEDASSAGADAKVRFSGASGEVAEETLKNFFKKVGEVEAFNLFKLKDGKSRGMGMVTYKTAKQAKQALLQLNGSKVQGCTIMVYTDHENDSTTWKPPQPSQRESFAGWYGRGPSKEWYEGSSDGCAVHFHGAPLDMSSDKLYSFFEECGKIKSFWLFRNPEGRSRGQGLVEYSSQKDARSAINYLNGWVIGSCTLNVQEDSVAGMSEVETWKTSQSTWNNKSQGEDWWDGHSVFFSGAPSQLPVGRVQSYFREFGVLDSFHMFRHPSGKPKGIGIVTFKDPQAATEVLKQGLEIEGWPLYLREAEDRGEQRGAVAASSERDYWSSYQAEWDSPAEVDPGKSIFFANVPFLSREIDLKRRFAQVGLINSFQLFKRQDGSSRGMGIVEYVTTSAARRACNTLSEANIDGRHVLIQPYNRQGYGYSGY